ncbi:hypothetical protein PAMP_023032 [Pampus punctatissimus]
MTAPSQPVCELYETAKDGDPCSQDCGLEEPSPKTLLLRKMALLHMRAATCADDPMSAFMCLMDRVMLQHICDCTVAEARRYGQVGWELSLAELKAFIALLLARGVITVCT